MGGLGEECRNRGQTASTKVLSCEYAWRVSGKVRSEGGGRGGGGTIQKGGCRSAQGPTALTLKTKPRPGPRRPQPPSLPPQASVFRG